MANFIKSFTKTIKHWYLPLIFGLLFMFFGIYLFSTPLADYLALVVMFSISFILSGLSDIFLATQNKERLDCWGWYLVNGLLTLVIGLHLMVNPEISITVLPFVVAFTLMFRSFQLMGVSLDLKGNGVKNWIGLITLSILGILFSFLLLANPVISGLSLVTLTALSFISTGIASVNLAFILKKIKNYPGKLNKVKIKVLQNEIK